jgi:hypothetical protein
VKEPVHYGAGRAVRIRLIAGAMCCALLGEAGCAAGDEREADEQETRVSAFYRLRFVGGERTPITLRMLAPMKGLNLSSGSLTLEPDGSFIGRYRLYSSWPGVGAPRAEVTDVEERGRYRFSGNRLVLTSLTRQRPITLEVTEGSAWLHGPLVGGRHPDTDTLGVARYERQASPPTRQ